MNPSDSARRLRRSGIILLGIAAWVLALGGTGCSAGKRRGPPPGGVAGGPPVMRVPDMAAKGEFFAGMIAVEVNLGPAARPGPAGGKPGEGESGPRKGGGRPEGGGGGRFGGPPGGGMGGGPGAGGGEWEPRANIREQNSPPARIGLRLANRGATAVGVEVLEFNSALGNFAVKPDRATIEAGAVFEAEPMTSRLGVSGASIPIKVRLRADGNTEERTLVLEATGPRPEPPPGNPQ